MKNHAYDSELQMFVEPPAVINLNRLAFLRWLIDNRRMEHRPAGPPSGPLVGKEVRDGEALAA